MTYYELQQLLDKHVTPEIAHEEVMLVDRNNLVNKIKHVSLIKNGTDKMPVGLPVIIIEVADVKA